MAILGLPPGTPNANAKAYSLDEVHEMLERTLRLSAENKITKDNAWDLRIINYMPSMVEELSQEEHFNFQKSSAVLQASTQVYSKRVDSAYEEVYASIAGINVKNGDQALPGPEGEQAEAVHRGTRARKHDANPASTLTTEEVLRGKEANETFEHDPMFFRLTKLFDESSASGLMMLNLPAYYQEQLVLSADEKPMEAFPTDIPPAKQPPSSQVQIRGLHHAAELLRASREADITPSILDLHAKACPELSCHSVDDEGIIRAALGMQGPPASHQGQSQANASGSQGEAGMQHGVQGAAEAGVGADADGDVGMEEAWQDAGDDDSGGPGTDQGQDQGPSDPGAPAEDAGFGGDLGDGNGTGLGDLGPEYEPAPLEFGMAEDDGSGDVGGDDLGGHDQTEASDDEASQMQSCMSQLAPYLDAPGQQPKQSSRSAAWAGSSFWRFRSKAPAAATAAAGVTQEKPAARGRAKAKPAFKFTDERIIPSIDLLDDTSQLRLKRATNVVTLTPQDMHFQESQLFCLPGLPGKTVLDVWAGHQAAYRISKQKRSRPPQSQPGVMPADEAQGFGDCGADDSGGFDCGFEGGFGDDFGTCEGSEGMGGAAVPGAGDACGPEFWDFQHLNDEQLMDQLLLPAPRKVAKVDLNYDKAAKQVDVKALKDLLGENIRSLHAKEEARRHEQQQEDAQDEEADNGFTFQEVIQQLPSQALGPNGEVSVHICFVCLLHLANEQSLSLTNGGSLGTLGISCQ